MTRYRVVCTEQEPVNRPPHRAHIVRIGTGQDPSKADKRWTVAEVYKAIEIGDSFFTRSPSTGAEAEVERWGCEGCGKPTLRSNPDGIRDNNLDSLRACNWT